MITITSDGDTGPGASVTTARLGGTSEAVAPRPHPPSHRAASKRVAPAAMRGRARARNAARSRTRASPPHKAPRRARAPAPPSRSHGASAHIHDRAVTRKRPAPVSGPARRGASPDGPPGAPDTSASTRTPCSETRRSAHERGLAAATSVARDDVATAARTPCSTAGSSHARAAGTRHRSRTSRSQPADTVVCVTCDDHTAHVHAACAAEPVDLHTHPALESDATDANGQTTTSADPTGMPRITTIVHAMHFIRARVPSRTCTLITDAILAAIARANPGSRATGLEQIATYGVRESYALAPHLGLYQDSGEPCTVCVQRQLVVNAVADVVLAARRRGSPLWLAHEPVDYFDVIVCGEEAADARVAHTWRIPPGIRGFPSRASDIRAPKPARTVAGAQANLALRLRGAWHAPDGIAIMCALITALTGRPLARGQYHASDVVERVCEHIHKKALRLIEEVAGTRTHLPTTVSQIEPALVHRALANAYAPLATLPADISRIELFVNAADLAFAEARKNDPFVVPALARAIGVPRPYRLGDPLDSMLEFIFPRPAGLTEPPLDACPNATSHVTPRLPTRIGESLERGEATGTGIPGHVAPPCTGICAAPPLVGDTRVVTDIAPGSAMSIAACPHDTAPVTFESPPTPGVYAARTPPHAVPEPTISLPAASSLTPHAERLVAPTRGVPAAGIPPAVDPTLV